MIPGNILAEEQRLLKKYSCENIDELLIKMEGLVVVAVKEYAEKRGFNAS